MRVRILIAVLLMSAVSALCQVEPSATGGAPAADADQPMNMPPPVSGSAYPSQVGSDTRSNVLSFGIGTTVAYFDNVLIGIASQPVSDEMYSISPVVTYNMQTPRQSRIFSYSSGYTFYQHMSALNYVDQAATGTFQERFTRHVTLNLSDSFVQSSGLLNQSTGSNGGSISGSVSGQQKLIITPFANEITNTANAVLSDQFAQNGMFGANFSAMMLNFPNPSQAAGLDNSQLYGGTAFLNRRLSLNDYLGGIYQFQRMTTSPTPSTTDVQTAWGYFTHYFSPTASFSLVAGPERAVITAPGAATFTQWTPAATFSLGWQAAHTNFAVSYMHSTSPMLGFPGLYSSDTGTASVTQKFNRFWTASASGSYGSFTNQDPQIAIGLPGGHTGIGTVSMQHIIGTNLNMGFGYTRLHERYGGLSAFTQNPNSDEVFVSVAYQFHRPIGR